MKQKKPLVSIIIPVYNAEKYIGKCLDSVVRQTYSNLEVIVVDDGSVDRSSEICKEYYLKYSIIKFFCKKNEGVAQARNYGLNKCKGTFISFVDSDDFIHPDYVQTLVDLLLDQQADISICGFYKIYEGKKNVILKQKNVEKCIFSQKEAMKHFLYQNKIDSSFWAKMYKKELFNKITIKNYKVFEDMDTLYQLILKANKIVYCSKILYYYLVRQDSLIHKQFSKENAKVIFILNEMETKVLQIYPDLESAFSIRKMNAYFYVLRNVKKNTEFYFEAKQFILKNRKKMLTILDIPKKTKWGIYISYINFQLIKPLFYLYNKMTKMTGG